MGVLPKTSSTGQHVIPDAYICLSFHCTVSPRIAMAFSCSLAPATAPAPDAQGFLVLTGAVGCLLLLLHTFTPAFAWVRKSRKPPPGPRGLPVLGNALQLPTTFAERAFHEWGKTFGTHPRLFVLDKCLQVLTCYERGHRIFRDPPHSSHRVELRRGRQGSPGQTERNILRPAATSHVNGAVSPRPAIVSR